MSTALASVELPTRLLRGRYVRTDVTYEHGRAQVELVLIDEDDAPQRVRLDLSLAALEDVKWAIDCATRPVNQNSRGLGASGIRRQRAVGEGARCVRPPEVETA